MSLDAARVAYAGAITAAARLQTAALTDALVRVHRERFLGPPPWRVLRPRSDGQPGLSASETSDVAELYQDVLVAIDPERGLNNGQPSFLLSCLDALDLKTGARVVHIGCGTGYYTAIAADAVGPNGSVLAFEVDQDLARRASANVEDLPQVRVEHGDASSGLPAQVDAMFVNAGVTDIRRAWVAALAPGGRLLVPLTAQEADDAGSNIGFGKMLRVEREGDSYSAEFILPVGIFHCVGARSASSDALLKTRFERGDSGRVRGLRLSPHAEDERCWLHGDVCITTSVDG